MTSTDGVRVAAVGPPDGTLPPDQVRAAILLRLADVARVYSGLEDPPSYTVRHNGQPVLMLGITFERRGNLVVSSIGSIPDPIKGVPMKGELFAFTDWELGRLPDHPTVFSVGNVVTGKGNIVASRRHATNVGEQLLASYLGLAEDGHTAEAELAEGVEKIAGHVDSISEAVRKLGALPEGRLAEIRQRARARQVEVGFESDVATWIKRAR